MPVARLSALAFAPSRAEACTGKSGEGSIMYRINLFEGLRRNRVAILLRVRLDPDSCGSIASTVGIARQPYCVNRPLPGNHAPAMLRDPTPIAILAAPVAIFALLLAVAGALGRDVPTPQFGRDYVLRIALDPDRGALDLPMVAGEPGDDRPLVVIDPGHGGHDPGAAGVGVVEKDLVLDLALALRDALVERGEVRVALTRSDDRYLLHAERYEIARRLGADLFVSIHADSAGEASEVAGASIYTLSNRASSEAAARFAERENRADRINGQEIAGQSEVVNTILVELSQRRTQEESQEFAALIQREGEGTIRFHPQPRRSAALKVLRAPDVPSVLFESGFITNEQEAARLASPEGRRRFAETLARAIRIYFVRQDAALLDETTPDTAADTGADTGEDAAAPPPGNEESSAPAG